MSALQTSQHMTVNSVLKKTQMGSFILTTIMPTIIKYKHNYMYAMKTIVISLFARSAQKMICMWSGSLKTTHFGMNVCKKQSFYSVNAFYLNYLEIGIQDPAFHRMQ